MAVSERKWIGKDVPRLEDPKLLAGRATYTDDVQLPGMLHAAVLRSAHAHARIVRIDASKARAELDFRPRDPVETLRDTLDHLRNTWGTEEAAPRL